MKFIRREKLKKYLPHICAFVVFLVVPVLVSAQPTNSGALPNPLGKDTKSFEGFIEKVLSNVVIPIGSVIVTFFLIFSGFLFVTAQGNEEKLKRAKTAILWTVIGAAVLLGAVAISELVESTVDELKTK